MGGDKMSRVPMPEESQEAYLSIIGKIFALAVEGDVADRMWPLLTALADVTYQIPELTTKLEEMRIKTEASKRATDAKYKSHRELLTIAKNEARRLWENGDTRLHHQMKQYLIEEYQDENGKYIFATFKDKPLLEALKEVAKELNRPELISGRKKSS